MAPSSKTTFRRADHMLVSQDVVSRVQLAEYGIDGDGLRRLATQDPARRLTWR